MVAIKGLYQKRGWWYFSRMRGGVRKTIALETRDEGDAIRMALELANGPDLAIGGTLEGEIEAFIAFKLARNEFSRFSAENKRLTLKRFARWIGPRTPIPSIKTVGFAAILRGGTRPCDRIHRSRLHDVLALVFQLAPKGTNHNCHESSDWHQYGTLGLRDESQILPTGTSRCAAGGLAEDSNQNHVEGPSAYDGLYHARRI